MTDAHSPGSRRILLADADAFFANVFAAVNPVVASSATLLIVGGAADSRGVVCSASYAARQFGVRAGMPMRRAAQLCPNATCVPVPRECGEYSRAIQTALREIVPVVEPASIDEFYCDLTGTERLYGEASLTSLAHRIRCRVRDATGLPVSFGGGTNRLIAKLAVERAKPKPGTDADGVYVIPTGAEGEFMGTLLLADIPFIGPRFQERLRTFGLITVRDALEIPAATLRQWFGDREGEWLWERCRGIDETPIDGESETKSMSRENTFPEDLSDEAALLREMGPLVRDAVTDLRDAGFRARTVTVRLRDYDFATRQAGRTVDRAVSTERAVFAVARELLSKLRLARRVPARLIGVTLSGLVPADAPDSVQLALFDNPSAPPPLESDRDRTVARTLDALRAKFGDNAVVPGLAFVPRPNAR
jgi:DNA polymerase-4